MARNYMAGALVVAILPAAPAVAAEGREPVSFITAGAPIEAPRGFEELCSFNADWCGARRPVRPQPAVAPITAVVPVSVGVPAPIAASAPGGAAQAIGIDARPFAIPGQNVVVVPASPKGFFKQALAFRPLTGRLPALVLDIEANAIPVRIDDAQLTMGRAPISPRFVKALDQALPVESPAMPGRRPTQDGATSPVTVPAAPALDEMAMLKSVNRRVNGHVIQRRDSEIFGTGERWRRSGIGRGATGDCEDLAIEKRLQLLAEGYPPERLSYAVVYRRDVGLHTILIARTGEGDFVLDSLSPYVRHWKKVEYSWIGMQSMQEPTRWFALGSRV